MSEKKPQSEWTDDDWAEHGYVRIVIHERGGLDDEIFLKRRFTSPVITQHEREELMRRAKKQHVANMKRRISDEHKFKLQNIKAMRPYSEYARKVRDEMRKNLIKNGNISLDQMTFFDLLDD